MGIERVVEQLETRFGYQTLRRVSELVTVRETLPTGIQAFDSILDGGLLMGATHSLSGLPTSGATSLTYQAIAGVQTQDLPVIYLDMAHLFDPPNAAEMGVQVEQLLLASPISLKNVLFLIQTLAQYRLPCLIVIDTPTRLPLSQLKPTLRQAPVTLLTLSPRPISQLQIELTCQRLQWQFAGRDVVRYTGEVSLRRHPFLPPRRTRITFSVPQEDERG